MWTVLVPGGGLFTPETKVHVLLLFLNTIDSFFYPFYLLFFHLSVFRVIAIKLPESFRPKSHLFLREFERFFLNDRQKSARKITNTSKLLCDLTEAVRHIMYYSMKNSLIKR